jgi:hypothetical protein
MSNALSAAHVIEFAVTGVQHPETLPPEAVRVLCAAILAGASGITCREAALAYRAPRGQAATAMPAHRAGLVRSV